jgi:hypothetical protein
MIQILLLLLLLPVDGSPFFLNEDEDDDDMTFAGIADDETTDSAFIMIMIDLLDADVDD